MSSHVATSLFQRQDHAERYSKFRPSPPDEIVQCMIRYVGEKIGGPLKTAVDIGCGTGQSTVILAPYFEKVVGVDVSEAQIQAARKDRTLPNVTYEVADANIKLPFEDASVHLVASCEAVHYFNLNTMYSETKRILTPNGAIVAYGYWIPLPYDADEKKTALMRKIINDDFRCKDLARFWSDVKDSVSLLENHYIDLPFPFKDVKRLDTVKLSELTLTDYIRYISTWSLYQKFYDEDKENAEKALKDVEKHLQNVLDSNKTPDEIVVKLESDQFLVIGRC